MTDRDRLIEIIGDKPFSSEYENYNSWEWAEHFADYLLSNGVIVPPCKVGDWVYVVSQGQGFNTRWNVYEGKVVDIHLDRHNNLSIRVENGEKFFGYYKSWFIHKTKEEAEKALEERTGKNA